MALHIKRVYEKAEPRDGQRILVDRLWPRGLSKAKAHIDTWQKDVAPSTELRTWFKHDPKKWAEFSRRYKAELKKNPKAVRALRAQIKKGTTTLLYGARDSEHTHALVLLQFLRAH